MKIGLFIIGIIFWFSSFSTLPSDEYGKQESKPLSKSITDGKEIYMDFCIQCHLGNGKGSESIPPLAGSDWLVNKRTESIHSIKYGQKGLIVVNGKKYNNTMPSMGLKNEEVADVMNYIMNTWGNKQKKQVTTAEVTAIKK